MERRYQVFVSSTFLDLQWARRELSDALLKCNCFPAGMELFPPADDEQFSYIKRIIDESDYYMLVSAGKYGSLHPKKGVSYTEMEYDYALETGKPIIRLLHRDPLNKLAGEFIEQNALKRTKLKEFREKIMNTRLVGLWSEPHELLTSAIFALNEIQKSHPREGWVRSGPILETQRLEIISDLKKILSADKDPKNTARTTNAAEIVQRMASALSQEISKISGEAEFLIELLRNFELSANQMDRIKISEHKINRANALEGQLSAIGGAQGVNSNIINLVRVVNGLKFILNRLVGDRELSIASEADSVFVLADQRHVEAVLMNLVVNARDATTKGGKITIEIREADQDECPEKDGVLEVSDDGTGVEEKISEAIFDPFFSTHDDGREGLGLAYCKSIIEKMNGHIGFVSEKNKGSTFSVTLPKPTSEEAFKLD